MKVEFHRRAEIALRFLDAAGRRRVEIALSPVRQALRSDALHVLRARKLRSGADEDFYSIKVDENIRLIASLTGDCLLVQDIVPQERIGHLLGRRSA